MTDRVASEWLATGGKNLKTRYGTATLDTTPGTTPAVNQLVQVNRIPVYSAASSPRSTLAALL